MPSLRPALWFIYFLRFDGSPRAIGCGSRSFCGSRDRYVAARYDRRFHLGDQFRPPDGTMEQDPARQTHRPNRP